MSEVTEILFGFEENGIVSLLEFCPNSDESGLPWCKPTGKTESVKGRQMLGGSSISYKGRCYDMAKYFSHLGRLAKELVEKSPKKTELVGLVSTSVCGTRKFYERLDAIYYSGKTVPVSEDDDDVALKVQAGEAK